MSGAGQVHGQIHGQLQEIGWNLEQKHKHYEGYMAKTGCVAAYLQWEGGTNILGFKFLNSDSASIISAQVHLQFLQQNLITKINLYIALCFISILIIQNMLIYMHMLIYMYTKCAYSISCLKFDGKMNIILWSASSRLHLVIHALAEKTDSINNALTALC